MARFGGFQRVAQQLRLLWHDTRGSSRQDAAAGSGGVGATHSADTLAAAASVPAGAAGAQQDSAISHVPQQHITSAAALQPAAAGQQSHPMQPGQRQGFVLAAAAEAQRQRSAKQSPALRDAAREMAVLMDERQLDHVPGRAELEATGAHFCIKH